MNVWTRAVRGGAALALAVGVGVALTGCGASEPAPGNPAPSAERPSATPQVVMDPALLEEIQSGLEGYDQSFRDVLACMEDAGWDVVDRGDNTFSIQGMTPEQRDPSREAYQTCSEATGWGVTSAISRDSLARLYQYELKTLECLESIGWKVPTAPPALEVYIERFNTSESWSAYSEISDQMTEASLAKETDLPDWDEVNAMCPQPIRWADLR